MRNKILEYYNEYILFMGENDLPQINPIMDISGRLKKEHLLILM